MSIEQNRVEVESNHSAENNNKTNTNARVESALPETKDASNTGAVKKQPTLYIIPRKSDKETVDRAEDDDDGIPDSIVRRGFKQVLAFDKLKRELPEIKSARNLVEQNLALPSVVVHGLLHQGSKMVLGGGSKSFKTWCLVDLAVSVANGAPWWGLDTNKGRVLYMNFEIQEGFFARRIDDISSAKGMPIDALENLDVWNLRGHCADLSDLMDLLLKRIEKEYALIIVDPIYKGMGKRDENAAGDINTLLNQIEKMAVRTGAAVVFGAHFSKGNQAAKESIDRMSGSGVFARDPDSILIMTQHENNYTYTIEPTLRNFAPMDPFCVRWNHPLMQRDEEADPANLKQAGAKVERFTAHQLFEVLNVQRLTTKEWEKQSCERTTMKPRTFAMKKKELVDDGRVELDENGKWKAINPIYPPGWNAHRAKENEVQQSAIAPCYN